MGTTASSHLAWPFRTKEASGHAIKGENPDSATR